ncbi:MAG: hypothetical protein ACE5GC_05630 [Acidimicrobiia bacterium]
MRGVSGGAEAVDFRLSRTGCEMLTDAYRALTASEAPVTRPG